LQDGGEALDAVIAAVVVLEDDALFNAGYGSYLTTAGTVEMDAGVTTARRIESLGAGLPQFEMKAGGVVTVSRVRNPILLARAVMERTPHVLMGGRGAEDLAREAGQEMCQAESMISPRARARWLSLARSKDRSGDRYHGTVGAVAIDLNGNLAAATSTGGVTLKLPGRIGDSAILGAGLYANLRGAASATGEGEAILKSALCCDAIELLRRKAAQAAASDAITRFGALTAGEAGIIIVDSKGSLGCVHNASAMEVATFTLVEGVRHRFAPGINQRG
jgi:beta-aspartyl-peptidase (threonine type)